MIMKVNDLSFFYGSEKILNNISVEIPKGEVVSILGQSGSGKSTLLKNMAGLEKPTSGEILFKGEKLKRPSNQIGVVFQDYSLFPWMTVGENIHIALKNADIGLEKAEMDKKIVSSLVKVGLRPEVYKKYPNELSGGMKQRVAICRALLIDSPLLLMDEPFGALDAITRTRLQHLIIDLKNSEEFKDKSVVFVTHDIDEALYISDRIIVLKTSPGEIIYETSIKREHEDTKQASLEAPYIVEKKKEITSILYESVEKEIRKGDSDEEII